MPTATKMKPDEKQNLRILRFVADGYRTNSDLKKKMKRDVRSCVNALKKDNSLEVIEGELVLTKRGAGRLRFAN